MSEKRITTEQALQPFTVPNYVLSVAPPRTRQEGLVEVPKYTLGELSVQTLELLCERFREDVLAKAEAQRRPEVYDTTRPFFSVSEP